MRYGRGDAEVRAVDGLTLTVEPGTVTSILGPNGAGKTTTIETCEGFRRPQSGRVRVLGLDPVADAAELRPRVGVMLQSGGAWLGVRAGEMLRHMASLYADPLPVDPLVERLGMASFGRTSYRRLSGGQKQRLSLAMAIVGRPELVFLDEPTAGLDPIGAAAFDQLILTLREAFGLTVFLVTHDLDTLYTICDRVAVLSQKRVLVVGSLDEVAANPDAWVQDYFHGPRGRAAQQAADRLREEN